MTDKNLEKYNRYRSQFERLDRALGEKFYLEAIFIEYAILEDKAWSALKHAALENREKNDGIDRKIDALKELKKSDELAEKYFSSKLLGDMKCWKNDRNKLVHNLMEAELDTRRLRGLALRGKRLIAEFGSKVTLFNRALNRRGKQ